MWAALWAVGVWLVQVAITVVTWAVTNPLGAFLVAAAVALGATMLGEMDFFGAQMIEAWLFGQVVIPLLIGATAGLVIYFAPSIGQWAVDVIFPQWFSSGMEDLSTAWWNVFAW